MRHVHEGIMRKVMVGAPAAALILLAGTSAIGATSGTIPPANPQANIPPNSSDWLTSIDSARADEGVGPMQVSGCRRSAP